CLREPYAVGLAGGRPSRRGACSRSTSSRRTLSTPGRSSPRRPLAPDLLAPGDHTTVYLLGDLPGLPSDLANRVGGLDVQLDSVVQHAVEHSAFAGNGRSRRRGAVQGTAGSHS